MFLQPVSHENSPRHYWIPRRIGGTLLHAEILSNLAFWKRQGPARPKCKRGFVYLIRLGHDSFGDIYKIGVSIRPETRFSQVVPRGSDAEIVATRDVYDPYDLESGLHFHYSNQRHPYGNEWFSLTSADVCDVCRTLEAWELTYGVIDEVWR